MKEVTHQEVMAFADQNLGKKINFGHLAQLTRSYKYEFILRMMEKAIKDGGIEKIPESRRIQYVTALCKKYATKDDLNINRSVEIGDMSIMKKKRAYGVLPKGPTTE